MKKISTLKKVFFLVFSLLLLASQAHSQVVGSFDIFTIPSRFGSKPLEYFSSNGFQANVKLMVQSTITSDKVTVNVTSVRSWLDKYYPSTSSTGWLVLDWETGPYDDLKDYPKGSTRFLTAEKELLKLINEVKSYRPNVKVSIYQMPYRCNSTYHNDLFNEAGKFDKIFTKLDFICPSVYIMDADEEVGHQKNLDFIKFNLDVSLSLGKQFNKPVHPFVWHKVHPLDPKHGGEIIQKETFAKYIKYIYAYSLNGTKAKGIWWWDGVADKVADLSGINDFLKGIVYNEVTYDAMIVDYAKYIKQVLNEASEQNLTVLDETAPVVTGVSEGGLYSISKRITFDEGTATLNNTAFTNGAKVSAEGTYTLVVKDAAGNVTTIKFAIDTTKPTGTLLINNNATLTNTINVTLNLTSKGEAVEMHFLNNEVWGEWEPIAATKVWTLAAGDGTKTASVQFRDAAGNISATAYDRISLKGSALIAVDKTAPVVTGVSEGGLYNVSKKITFDEGTATLNNTTFTNGATVSAEGAYKLVVKDAANNVTTIKFAIDTTKPTGTLVINNNDEVTDTVSVMLNLTSKGEAVEMRFLNNEVWGEWESVAATKAWTLAAGNGTKTASVQFRDAASNLSASIDDIITLKEAASAVTDSVTTKPVVVGPVVTGVVDGGKYNADKRIYFTKGTATLNNNPFSSGAKVSAEGVYTLVATDIAGNVTTVKFEIDRTKPTGTIFINNNLPVTNTINVTLNLTSKGEAVEMRFLNNEVWGEWESVAATKAWTLAAGNGTKTASVQFRDAAGNISATAYDRITLDESASITTNDQTFIVTETTAPIVTGVVDGGKYNADKRIYFNEGTATLNNNPFSSNTVVSAAGVYTLVVTDVDGNVTTVGFTIDKTKPTGTLLINNNASITNTINVTLDLTSQGEAVEMRFKNNEVWGEWEPVAATKAWTLAAGNGTKTASVQFRDEAGNISTTAYDLITLKESASTVSRLVQVEKEVSNSVVAYPNPATTKLHVEVSEAGTGETIINLLDLTGQVVLVQKVNTTTSLISVLDVDQLQPGVYMLNINTPKGHISKRIVVQ